MSVLALRSFHAKPEVIVIAFLWNPFPISGWFLLMRLLEISVHRVVGGLKKQFRILTILHSLIHEKELLHLKIIVLNYLLLLLTRPREHVVKVRRTLAYQWLRQVQLVNLLVYYLLHLQLRLSKLRWLLLLMLSILLLLCLLMIIRLNSCIRQWKKRETEHWEPIKLLCWLMCSTVTGIRVCWSAT
jgi:hypothetical protein